MQGWQKPVHAEWTLIKTMTRGEAYPVTQNREGGLALWLVLSAL